MPPSPAVRLTPPWRRALEAPIALPAGRELVTLADCVRHILAQPKAAQEATHWQAAFACVLGAAERREPLLHARIAMLQAIHHGRPKPAPGPRRKAAKAYRIVR